MGWLEILRNVLATANKGADVVDLQFRQLDRFTAKAANQSVPGYHEVTKRRG